MKSNSRRGGGSTISTPAKLSLRYGDFVVVKTDLGVEMGRVVGTKEIGGKEVETAKLEIKPIFRKANTADMIKFKEKDSQKKKRWLGLQDN